MINKSTMDTLVTNEALTKEIIDKLQELHFKIYDAVRTQLFNSSIEKMSKVAAQGEGDVSYTLDVSAEKMIEDFFKEWSIEGGVVVISEGLGVKTFPADLEENSARFRIIIDPIDGTREIMYDKRSAWILTGVALNKSKETKLSDIEIAIQTELPPSKQNTASVVIAVKGQGAFEELWDIGSRKIISPKRRLQSSGSKTLAHGFAIFVNFFPGTRTIISQIGDKIIEAEVGPVKEGQALVFDDQYITTGGQIYLLASGKYRLVADFRPKLAQIQSRQGKDLGLCSHPYDLSTYLIAVESGAIITNTHGTDLIYPLDTYTNTGWIGYANDTLRKKIEPELLREIEKLNV